MQSSNLSTFSTTSGVPQFKSKQTVLSPESRFSSDLTFEDKVLLEKALDDFKNSRVSSHKKIMRLLNN